jgi:hypothetical protein
MRFSFFSLWEYEGGLNCNTIADGRCARSIRRALRVARPRNANLGRETGASMHRVLAPAIPG